MSMQQVSKSVEEPNKITLNITRINNHI